MYKGGSRMGIWEEIYIATEKGGYYWDTSIYQYLYQYCRYWKILVKYW
jgi:hypothetical protein